MEGQGGRGEEEEEDIEEDERDAGENDDEEKEEDTEKKKKKKRKTSQMRGCSTIYTLFYSKAFESLDLHRRRRFRRKSYIQRLKDGWNRRRGGNWGGKTMAFGLPILQRLMQDKEEENWYEDYRTRRNQGKERNTYGVDRGAGES